MRATLTCPPSVLSFGRAASRHGDRPNSARRVQITREVTRVERVTQPQLEGIGLAPSLLFYTLPRLRRAISLFPWGAWM